MKWKYIATFPYFLYRSFILSLSDCFACGSGGGGGGVDEDFEFGAMGGVDGVDGLRWSWVRQRWGMDEDVDVRRRGKEGI